MLAGLVKLKLPRVGPLLCLDTLEKTLPLPGPVKPAPVQAEAEPFQFGPETALDRYLVRRLYPFRSTTGLSLFPAVIFSQRLSIFLLSPLAQLTKAARPAADTCVDSNRAGISRSIDRNAFLVNECIFLPLL